MKRISLLPLVFIFTLHTSCNHVNASSDSTSSATGGGDASFSYNLDGSKVSGGTVDLTNNTAHILQRTAGKSLQFFLSDGYSEKTEVFAHSLRFNIPYKTGTTTLKPEDDTWNVEFFLTYGNEGKYTPYTNEDFTITITNISSTRVTGTFAGKEKVIQGQPADKSELTITGGKFDIPLTSKGY